MDKRPNLLIVSPRPRPDIFIPLEGEEVWTMNEGFKYLARVNRVFEMHDYPWRLTVEGSHWNYFEELKTLKIPIVMLQHYNDIPSSVQYPLEKVIPLIPGIGYKEEMFASTQAYMLALGIAENHPIIKLRGFRDMSEIVKANLSFWIGVAAGKGITVWSSDPEKLPFTSEYMYGYGEREHLGKTGKWDCGTPIKTKTG